MKQEEGFYLDKLYKDEVITGWWLLYGRSVALCWMVHSAGWFSCSKPAEACTHRAAHTIYTQTNTQRCVILSYRCSEHTKWFYN